MIPKAKHPYLTLVAEKSIDFGYSCSTPPQKEPGEYLSYDNEQLVFKGIINLVYNEYKRYLNVVLHIDFF